MKYFFQRTGVLCLSSIEKWISLIVLEIMVNSEQWHCGWAPEKATTSISSELLFHLGTKKAIKKIHLVTRSNKILRIFKITDLQFWGVFFNYRTNFVQPGNVSKMLHELSAPGLGLFLCSFSVMNQEGTITLVPRMLVSFSLPSKEVFSRSLLSQQYLSRRHSNYSISH